MQTLTAYRGKWVVLYFYPKDDTPGCTEQACNFRDDIVALNMLGAQIIGVSVDDTKSHTAFASKYKLPLNRMMPAVQHHEARRKPRPANATASSATAWAR